MSIKELRTATGMTQKQFAQYFGISQRTIEEWERGGRKCAEWILQLIEYKLKNEGLI